MTNVRVWLGTILGLVVACATASAQSAPLLVDTTWLSQHLADRDLVLLHVGGKPEYARAHIARASQILDEDLALPHDHSVATDLMLELPPAAVLRERLAALGVSDDSRIVVYAGGNAAVQSATRIIFTLDYLGLGAQTSLLNGGIAAWTKAGQPTTADAPVIRAGRLTARETKPLVVNADFVKSVPGRAGYKLVDARAAVFYKGIEPTFNKNGHIPGAISLPFTDMTDTEMRLDRDRLAGVFSAAGIAPGDTVVAYCHVGQQATAVIFAARLLGHPVVLYDGAFQDWAVNARGGVDR